MNASYRSLVPFEVTNSSRNQGPCSRIQFLRHRATERLPMRGAARSLQPSEGRQGPAGAHREALDAAVADRYSPGG